MERSPDKQSVFDTDSPIDVTGRELMRSVVAQGGVTHRVPSVIQLAIEMNLELSEKFGMDSLQIGRMGSSKFKSLWFTHPGAMLAPVPKRVAGSLTVLRPLDLRFFTEAPPSDVTRLSIENANQADRQLATSWEWWQFSERFCTGVRPRPAFGRETHFRGNCQRIPDSVVRADCWTTRGLTFSAIAHRSRSDSTHRIRLHYLGIPVAPRGEYTWSPGTCSPWLR